MRPENARVKRMIAYMHEHFAEDLKLSAIAGDAGVCATEGLRCFRQEVDVTPIIFLTDVRLRHAALMLRDSELSATQIAAACGFSSVSLLWKGVPSLHGRPSERLSGRVRCEAPARPGAGNAEKSRAAFRKRKTAASGQEAAFPGRAGLSGGRRTAPALARVPIPAQNAYEGCCR